MKPDPRLHSDLLAIAKRLVWFESPEFVLDHPPLFLAHVMTNGTEGDLAAVRQCFDDQAFRDALQSAPPGLMDVRSWHYWHLVLGITPVPPVPTRRIP